MVSRHNRLSYQIISAAVFARALKRGDLGTFRKGAAGDASILTLETGRFDYVDSTGEHLEGEKRLTANGVIIGGAVFAA